MSEPTLNLQPELPVADDLEPLDRPFSRDDLRDVLNIVLRAAQLMTENGANTSRVEETACRLGEALGAELIQVYATPTGIIATASAGGDHRTKIQRVGSSNIDLSRVTAVLDVSRLASGGGVERSIVAATLERIARAPRIYGHSLTAVSVGVACACFAMLFGGGWLEGLAAGTAAALSQVVRTLLVRWGLNRVLVTGVVAALATALALILAWLLGVPAVAVAVTAAVLLLVPGALMVSAIADLFRGDTLSGMARSMSSLLVIGAIGTGIWITLLVSGADIAPGLQAHTASLLDLPLALVATLGFAIVFDVPQRALLTSAGIGMLGYATRQSGVLIGMPLEAAMFSAGLVIGLAAAMLARVQQLPAAIFSIPGFIPLVPGVIAFRTVFDFFNNDYVNGTANLVRAALLTAAIAVGLGTINALMRLRWRPFAESRHG